jgi:acetylornithine deacetylase/succinyl-diaminopimelate desuccinylase-like protein
VGEDRRRDRGAALKTRRPAAALAAGLALFWAPPARAAAQAPPAARRAAAAAAEARAWRARHEGEILAEFTALLALPNVASDTANIERNAATIRAMLERRGVTVRVLRVPGAPPLVIGDLAAKRGARTLAFYAHYDGQPADTASWNGLPWTPVLRDPAGREIALAAGPGGDPDPESRIWARSAGDDKAPIIAMLAALDAMREKKRQPEFALRFVFEGEEEAGSPHLADYLERDPELRPDAWILCDGPVHPSGRAELAFGARGITSVEITLYGPIKGLHDGHYGNWVPNPAARLARLIASMRDDEGGIRIAGFGEDVRAPSAADLAALKEIPDVEAALRREFEIGGTEGAGAPLNQLLMRPALNVRGLQAGRVGARATNSIPTEASASLDFRLVPDQTPESVRSQVERHVAAQGYTIVRAAPDSTARMANARLARLEWGPGYPPARTALDIPLSREIAGLMAAAGREPVRLPILGGSIPMYLFQQPHSTPVIVLPIANHDDNQHAPNENLRLQNLWDGIETFAALFAGLGAQ